MIRHAIGVRREARHSSCARTGWRCRPPCRSADCARATRSARSAPAYNACLRLASVMRFTDAELILRAPAAPVLHLLEQPIELLGVDRRPGRRRRRLCRHGEACADGDDRENDCEAGCEWPDAEGNRRERTMALRMGEASYNAAMATLAATDLRSAAAGHRSPLAHDRGPHARRCAAWRLGLRPRARHGAGRS